MIFDLITNFNRGQMTYRSLINGMENLQCRKFLLCVNSFHSNFPFAYFHKQIVSDLKCQQSCTLHILDGSLTHANFLLLSF